MTGIEVPKKLFKSLCTQTTTRETILKGWQSDTKVNCMRLISDSRKPGEYYGDLGKSISDDPYSHYE